MSKNLPKAKVTILWLNTAIILVKPAYQRPHDQKRINRIANHFDWSKFGVIVVFKGKNGYEVCDGQHRTSAAQLVYPEGVLVPCIVITTPPHVYFCSQNDERRNVTPNDSWWANYEGGEPNQRALNKLMKRIGYKLIRPIKGRQPKTTNCCSQVATLQCIRDTMRAADFERLFRFIHRRFPLEGQALTVGFLRGIKLAVDRIGMNKVITNLEDFDTLTSDHIISYAKTILVNASSDGLMTAVMTTLTSLSHLRAAKAAAKVVLAKAA